MPKSNLPTYAIVELLMRLEAHNNSIGHYKDHNISKSEVIVKTTGGAIRFPETLVMQQFQDPELVPDEMLLETVSSFRPIR